MYFAYLKGLYSLMKRKLCLFCCLIFILAFFASCDFNTNQGVNDKNGGISDGKNDNSEAIPDDEKNDEESDEKADAPEIEEGQTLFYSGSEIMFLHSADSECEDAAFSLLGYVDKNITGRTGDVFIGFENMKYANEIIIGNIPGRSSSAEAYRLLGEMKSSSAISESRYLVYADNGEVAFAYEKNEFTSLQTIQYVVDMFVEKYIDGKESALFEKGVVMSGTLNLIELQAQIDKKNDDLRWKYIADTIGDEDIYLAFRAFFEQMFNDEIVNLIASYYDPATGLFYSSASGKRAEGIYPNPEATGMILSYVLNTGMLNGLGVRYLIPDIARHKIIYYLKSIQAENGEFYISQMPKNSIDSNRLGRDRGACVGLLDRLGATPTYSVGSMTGDGIDGEEYWADLVSRGIVRAEDKPIIYRADKPSDLASKSFSESVAAAVSKVVSASDETSQFQSHVDFIKWLLAKDPYNNPYTAMSNTSSAAVLITEWSEKLGGYSGEDTVVNYNSKSFDLYKGETLKEILIRWMNGNINSAGLFGKVTSAKDNNGNPVYDGFYGGWGYQNSNGFFKAIGRYSEMKIAYPEARKAAESLLLGINSDESVGGNILVIYNVWSSLNSLRLNIESYYTESDKEELLAFINDGLKKQVEVNSETGETKAYAAVAMEKCTNKILAFKKSDGGFGHAVEFSTPNWQGGLKVAISTDNLSDIDAITCSSMSLGNALSALFGFSFLKDIPMNTNSDLLSFLDIMQKQKYVVKVDPNGEIPSNN